MYHRQLIPITLQLAHITITTMFRIPQPTLPQTVLEVSSPRKGVVVMRVVISHQPPVPRSVYTKFSIFASQLVLDFAGRIPYLVFAASAGGYPLLFFHK